MTIEKKCSMCKSVLPVEHFHLNKAKKDGRAGCCKECQKAVSRKHYEANKQAYFDRNQQVRRRQKERLLEIKSQSPCRDCGQTFHPFIMEFDHLSADDKTFSIGRRGSKSNKQIQTEIDKCDLLCANCHKLRTFRRNQQNPRYVLATYR